MYADNLEKLPEKDSVQYAVDNFVLENVVISGTGVSHDRLKQLVQVSFADLKKGKAGKAASPWVGGDVRIRKDLDGVSHVGIGFPIKESNGLFFIIYISLKYYIEFIFSKSLTIILTFHTYFICSLRKSSIVLDTPKATSEKVDVFTLLFF